MHNRSILGRLWRLPDQPEAGKSPESEASSCGADSPGDRALYAVSIRRLIALHSRLPLPLVALACGSPHASLQPFRPFLTETPLPSTNTFVNILKTLTGFTYRELPCHAIALATAGHPISSRPCQAYTRAFSGSQKTRAR